MSEQRKNDQDNQVDERLLNTFCIALPEDKGRGYWSRVFTSAKGEPLPYLSRPSYNTVMMSSGIGTLICSVFLIIFSSWATYMAVAGGELYGLVLILFVLCGIVMTYHSLRRIAWEHRNSGALSRAVPDMVAWAIGVGVFILLYVYAAARG